MNKSDLISAIAENANMEKNKVEVFLNSFVEVVEKVVASGDSVQLVGFGTFEKRHRESRTGRNPQTGEELTISASDVPVFKAGKNFKDIVNSAN